MQLKGLYQLHTLPARKLYLGNTCPKARTTQAGVFANDQAVRPAAVAAAAVRTM